MPRAVEALGRDQLGGLAVDPVERRHVAEAAALRHRYAAPGQPLNLQLTPHVGAMTEEASRRVAAAAIAALEAFWTRADAIGPPIARGRGEPR